MNDKKRLNSYEDLPLVLDVADIQRIMGISRASAYELVHTASSGKTSGRHEGGNASGSDSHARAAGRPGSGRSG